MTAALRKDLEGVVVTESSHAAIGGDAGELVDRGCPIEALARWAPSEEVVDRPVYGELPTTDERYDDNRRIRPRARDAPPTDRPFVPNEER